MFAEYALFGFGSVLASATSYLMMISRTRSELATQLVLLLGERNAIIGASPMAIYMLDQNGIVKFWNDSAERIFGYTVDETLQKLPPSLIPEHVDEFIEHLTKARMNALATGVYETKRRHKQGRILDVRVHWARVNNENGTLLGIMYLIEDISERRKLERQLKSLFDTLVDLILVTDRQGNFMMVSPSSCEILGYNHSEMEGHNALDFIYPEDLNNTREEMRQLRRGQVPRSFECRYIHKNGRIVTLDWTGVWSQSEQQHYFIGRDMTEQKKLEEQLIQSQKLDAIGRLTGGMAHDFNNMLGIIIGNLDMLCEIRKTDGETIELAKDALSAALRGADLTRRLLAFARQQPLRPQRANVNELVNGITKLLRRTLGEQFDIALHLSPTPVWPIVIDPGQLESALTNLATNARDAMPDGGHLIIGTRNHYLDKDYAALHAEVVPGDYAMIEVTDSGIGIGPEVIPHIFEPFFTTKAQGKGTGLGLSMVFGFIKQSGGHINLYSEPGLGTTFRLFFPRDPEDDTPAPVEEENLPPAMVPGNGELILIVEDDVSFRKVVVRQLKELGYNVMEADNAETALRVVKINDNLDLMFTDIVLPGGVDGLVLAEQVRKIRPHLAIIFTSGFSRINGIADKMSKTDMPLLTKPYRRNDLAEIVRLTLNSTHPETR